MVSRDDGVEINDAVQRLVHYGSTSVAQLFHWSRNRDGGPHPDPKLPDHMDGMMMLDLSPEEIRQFSSAFYRGTFPAEILDAVVGKQDAIQGLHPDKYPFRPSSFDVLYDGLKRSGIDTGILWERAAKGFRDRGREDLERMYGFDGPTIAVTNLLQHYALTRHDIGVLDRAGKEVHF